MLQLVDFAERFPEYPNFLLCTKFSNPYVNMETMTRTILYFIERKKNHVINYYVLPEPDRMKEAVRFTEKYLYIRLKNMFHNVFDE